MVSARARALPENSVTQNALGLSLTDFAEAGYNRSPGTDHQKFSIGRNLGPGQRRRTRPWRWPRSRCWRRSRRRRCRCCCSGAGCWRGGRCRSGSWRRRRCASSYRSKDIDPTPTEYVVWRAGVSALSRINVNSGVIQRVPASGKLMLQAGNSRPQQGHRARNMRSSHGRAAGKRICIIGGVRGRTRVCAGRTDVGFDAVTSISCNRAAAAERSNGISAGVQRADRVGRFVNSGRILHR